MSSKKSPTNKELVTVAIIVIVGFVIINAVAPHAWSLSKALNIPDWVIWVIGGAILLGGLFGNKGK